MTQTSSRKPEILCIGFGALGTVYSYLLSRGSASITAVARSNYTCLTTTGIHISSSKYGEIPNWKPNRTIREAEPHLAQDRIYDFVVCTFKNVPDHKAASSIIRPFLKNNNNNNKDDKAESNQAETKLPTIVLLQNGVGIEEEVMRNLVETEKEQDRVASGVISAVAWIGANLAEQGTKVMHGTLERLEMGVYPRSSAKILPDGRRQVSAEEQAALDNFTSIYTNGGGGGRAVEDVEAIRWQKVLWNASWGGISTLARQPVSTLLQEDTLHYSVGVVRRIMLEIVYVARSCGLGEQRFPISSVDDAITITLSTSSVPSVNDPTKGGNLAGDFKPSILLDLENGRPMELEPIIGNVVRKAREKGVDTPRLDLILAALKPCQMIAVSKVNEKEQIKEGEGKGEGVTKFSDLTATSRGNWPEGAPVSRDSKTYL
ncbi:uncharacterized protein MEPE_00300 [Melanopsichium pennsylvanicum]|uniref:6-phosphogluconate dehydrogenase C-terminal domain-like protein n=2 Tax=Melanopsichium pennsylvanicum TaxID=63383 RepID=A0AAJ4XGH4_9BASI|nr:6-phosphogluconate dehydrogenase c-terminal domain-like protein [Melanopsichium pennsylvanicum 4]SNX81595.1 uncharacterized protein MEPE_00300 [Melanopsichium pennsylvanicum]